MTGIDSKAASSPQWPVHSRSMKGSAKRAHWAKRSPRRGDHFSEFLVLLATESDPPSRQKNFPVLVAPRWNHVHRAARPSPSMLLALLPQPLPLGELRLTV